MNIAWIISTKKSYFSLNVQTVTNQKYCFQNLVIQWPVSVCDPHIFFNSSVNKMLRKGTIPICKVNDPIPVFLFGNSGFPFLPFITQFSSGINIQEKSSSALNDLVQVLLHLVHETCFLCLQRVMDININTLPRIPCSCLALHNYFEL